MYKRRSTSNGVVQDGKRYGGFGEDLNAVRGRTLPLIQIHSCHGARVWIQSTPQIKPSDAEAGFVPMKNTIEN